MIGSPLIVRLAVAISSVPVSSRTSILDVGVLVRKRGLTYRNDLHH